MICSLHDGRELHLKMASLSPRSQVDRLGEGVIIPSNPVPSWKDKVSMRASWTSRTLQRPIA